MGPTIHYSGRLKSAAQLSALIDDVRDIAIGNDWNYDVFHDKFKNDAFSTGFNLEHLYGITITPDVYESFSFTFLSDGRMCGLQNFELLEMEEYIAKDHVFSISINTHDLDVEVYKQLIVILDYISGKYIQDFKCVDEGHYWETRNEELLKETIHKNKNYIEHFRKLITEMPQNDDQEDQDYVYQIANIIHKQNENTSENLPKLSVEEEFKLIELKREIDLEIKYAKDEEFFNEFLDNPLYMNPDLLEEEYKKEEKTPIYEVLGKPTFKKSSELSAKELSKELKKFLKMLSKKYIDVEMWYDYDNEDILYYDFITNIVFNEEIAERFIGLYPHEYIYENYYPNHPEELHSVSFDFWKNFLNATREFFDEFELENLENSEEIFAFRNIFPSFKEIKVVVNDVVYDLEAASAYTYLLVEFEGIKDNGQKTHYKGESVLELTYDDLINSWNVVKMTLPK